MPPVTGRTFSTFSIGEGNLFVHLSFPASDVVCHSCIRKRTGNSQSNPIIIDDDGVEDEPGILQNGQPCPNCSNILPMGGPWIINHPLPPLSPTLPTGSAVVSYANIVPMDGIPIIMDHMSYRSVAPSFPPIVEGGETFENEQVDDEDIGHDDSDDELFELDIDNLTYEEQLEIDDTVEVVSRGLTVDQIRQCMRRTTYRLRRNMSSDEQCCICLEHFRNWVAIGKLDNCDHTFHFKCIKDWLVQKNDCPICKRVALNP